MKFIMIYMLLYGFNNIYSMNKNFIKKIWTVCAIFSCIGLPLFFSGCGTDIPNTCFSYIEEHGQVYNYLIEQDLCKKCTQHDTKNKCTNYNYYNCYDGYLKISYERNHQNNTCYYKVYENSDDKFILDNKLNYYYPIGYESKLFINKVQHSSCSFNAFGLQALTYTGLTFTIVSTGLFICGLFLFIMEKLFINEKIYVEDNRIIMSNYIQSEFELNYLNNNQNNNQIVPINSENV